MSKRSRSSSTGVVWRQVPEDLKVMNIYGKEVVNTKPCKCCGEVKHISEFYLQSSSKSKHSNEVRDDCVVCWDKYNGKKVIVVQEEQTDSNTLINFIDSEKSNA